MTMLPLRLIGIIPKFVTYNITPKLNVILRSLINCSSFSKHVLTVNVIAVLKRTPYSSVSYRKLASVRDAQEYNCLTRIFPKLYDKLTAHKLTGL